MVKESMRPKTGVLMRRIVRKHGRLPGKSEAATTTVLQQVEVLSSCWAGGPAR
jgi:hypothetical protein